GGRESGNRNDEQARGVGDTRDLLRAELGEAAAKPHRPSRRGRCRLGRRLPVTSYVSSEREARGARTARQAGVTGGASPHGRSSPWSDRRGRERGRTERDRAPPGVRTR